MELLHHPLFVTAIWTFEYEPRGAGTEVTCSVDATMKRRWVLLLPALRRARKALAGDPERKNKIIGRTPLARLGEPADIGWAAVYLASPASKFITGVILPVDGGVSIGF